MKKIILILITAMLISFSAERLLKDGRYTGTSRSIYTNEPYYGSTQILIDKGKITSVDFVIRDSVKHVFFDGQYEKYFPDNDLYISQCRNDWHGIQSYPDSLVKYQDLGKVDVISGATWSYNIFKAAAKKALKEAQGRPK